MCKFSPDTLLVYIRLVSIRLFKVDRGNADANNIFVTIPTRFYVTINGCSIKWNTILSSLINRIGFCMYCADTMWILQEATMSMAMGLPWKGTVVACSYNSFIFYNYTAYLLSRTSGSCSRLNGYTHKIIIPALTNRNCCLVRGLVHVFWGGCSREFYFQFLSCLINVRFP